MSILSQQEPKGTPPVGSKSKSKSRSDTSPIPMAGDNELAQLVKMMEKIQTTLDESEKKMTLMATTLPTLIKDTPIKAPKTYKGTIKIGTKKTMVPQAKR